MEHIDLVGELQTMLGIVLYAALPPLVAALAVGLLVGILQAVTQVQDQSLPLTFKMVAILAVLFLAGGTLSAPLLQQAQLIFDGFSGMTR